MDVLDFVLAQLPPPPARVLEVGCGSGDLARALAARGYGVTAIDPEAPEGGIFRKMSLEDFSEPSSFDAVVASRSLHHVGDLDAGLDKIESLLPRGGSLILDEFAWEQMDETTARWYLSRAEEPAPEHAPLRPGSYPEEWIAEHEGLHTGVAMRAALDARFEPKAFAWVPYIARHYLERDDLTAAERDAIHSGAIAPLGFRYVGARR